LPRRCFIPQSLEIERNWTGINLAGPKKSEGPSSRIRGSARNRGRNKAITRHGDTGASCLRLPAQIESARKFPLIESGCAPLPVSPVKIRVILAALPSRARRVRAEGGGEEKREKEKEESEDGRDKVAGVSLNRGSRIRRG